MAEVWIPSLLRELTGGQRSVSADGKTVGELLESLEARFPGIKMRLCDGDRLRPNISVIVDGRNSHLKLREKVSEDSEVHFLQAISGGDGSNLSGESNSPQTG